MLSGMFGISPSATESINAPAITPASPAAKPIVAMFYGYILGMDTFALGLIKAAEIIESKTVDGFIEKKYASFNSELGQKIRSGEATLSQLSELACEKKSCETPCSGRQEKIQGEINRILFK